MTGVSDAQAREDRLRRLMDAYELPIRRMCCIYLRDDHLAADAVQETFLKAYLALEKFRGESSEKTWLMRIAVNVCHSMRRTGCGSPRCAGQAAGALRLRRLWINRADA